MKVVRDAVGLEQPDTRTSPSLRDGDVRVPCDRLFQADVVEDANARLPTVAWLTRGMARSVVDADRQRCCRLALETGNSSEAR